MNNFNNFDELGIWIDLEKLVPELIRNGLLFGDSLIEYNRILLHDIKLRKRLLLTNILNPNNQIQIIVFIHILLHTGHDYVARYLSSNFLKPPVDISDLIDLTQCDPRYDTRCTFSFGQQRKLLNLTHGNIINSMSNTYKSEASPRGYCLLINNYFTVGTFKEMQYFRDIYYQLHFDVIMRKNLSKKEIIQNIEELSKREELKQHDAFIFMIIAHGNSKNEIFGFDGEPLNIRYLMDLMDQKNCPNLIGKPRIFFFNCCRGERNQVDLPNLNPANDLIIQNEKLVTNSNQDEFVCYSTLHGFTAKVDFDSGTIFGEKLAESLIQKAAYKDLNQILTRTNGYQGTNSQVFQWSQSLTRDFYFFPNVPAPRKLITETGENNNVINQQ